MEFKQILQQRRACHAFLPNTKIPKQDLEKIIQLTSLSPSGYNAQPWEFIIIQEKENLKKIQKIAFNQQHLQHASAVIIVLGDLEIGRNVDSLLQDWLKKGYCTEQEIPAFRNSIAKNRSIEKKTTMALRNSMLAAMTLIYAAEDLGYNTCPMMGFSHKDLIPFLNIPQDRTISLMIAIGKQDPNHPAKPRLTRKNPQQMIHWEQFSNNS